jgi:predicted Zn-dependent protease
VISQITYSNTKKLIQKKQKIYNAESRLRVGVDQDWVLAKLTDKWVKYYNTIFGDNLKVEDIKEWDITKFVKPEAKECILNILIYINSTEI